MKPCLDCGRDTPNTRCVDCARAYDRQRRPSGGRRYGRTYQRNRAVVLAGNPRCSLCGAPMADQADHVTPRADGGSDAVSNLRPVCGSCNARRGAMTR